MNTVTREFLLLKLTKKLVICTSFSLVVIMGFLFTLFSDADSSRSYLIVIIFSVGLIGGFVSIQQRVHKVSDQELQYLSNSWASVLLIPIYGGIFAIVIHVIFLSEIITGKLFPMYSVPSFSNPATLADFKNFFVITLPQSGQDTAKMLFWAFTAGFSERLVPQIIHNVQGKVEEEIKDDIDPALTKVGATSNKNTDHTTISDAVEHSNQGPIHHDSHENHEQGEIPTNSTSKKTITAENSDKANNATS